MKTIFLYLIVSCFLCQTVFSQDSTEDKYYYEKPSRIDAPLLMMCKGIGWMQAAHTLVGDIFDDLAFVAETNKKEYAIGEPVGIRLYIQNLSDEPKNICRVEGYGVSDFMVDLMEIKVWGKTVPFTRYGLPRYNDIPGISSFYTLKPGEKFLIYEEFKDYRDTLNLYYDLTIRGVYELHFQRKYIDGEIAKFPKPCSITFEIIPKPYVPPEIVWEEPEDNIQTDR